MSSSKQQRTCCCCRRLSSCKFSGLLARESLHDETVKFGGIVELHPESLSRVLVQCKQGWMNQEGLCLYCLISPFQKLAISPYLAIGSQQVPALVAVLRLADVAKLPVSAQPVAVTWTMQWLWRLCTANIKHGKDMKRYEKDWKGFDDWRTTTAHHEEVRQNALKKMGILWEYMGILTEWQCPMSDSKSVAALPPRLPLLLSCSAQQLLHELDKESSHELPHCKNVQNTKLKQTQSIQSVDQNAAKWCKTVQNGTTWCKMHVLLEAATKEDSMFMGTLSISMHYIALLWLHMFALGCNQIMDCGTPPVHSRSPWAACTSVDRSARDANARVHIRVGMMANVFTHTLVSFRSYFSEPCPCQTHFYDIFVLKTFIEEISWLNLSNRSSLKFRPSGLGFLQFLSRFAKAWCCTMLHYLARLSMVELPLCVCKSVLLVFLLQNVLQRCQGLWTPLGKIFGLQLYCKWFLLKVFCVFKSRQHRRKLQS